MNTRIELHTRLALIPLALILVLAACSLITQPKTLYAAPQGDGVECTRRLPCTLQQAQVLARQLAQAEPQDVRVYLRGGVYRLDAPLEFGPADSGQEGHLVSYQAYHKETPVISGGGRITDWESAENGVFRASVGDRLFRQLYVSGKRAIRARTPNPENETDMGPYLRFQQWDTQEKRLLVSTADIGKWGEFYQAESAPTNPVEMVVQSHWHLYILRVGNLQPGEEFTWVIPQVPERDEPAFGHIAILDAQGNSTEQEAYFWENAREFLDAPGEWFLDETEGVLYYKPRPGEDLSQAEVIAPSLKTLLSVEGTTDQPVQNLEFTGLTFEYSTWLEPSDAGYAPWQAALRSSTYQGTPFPGMVRFSIVHNIGFIDNTLRHSGMHGLVTEGVTQGLRIEDNLFEDLSGAALMLDVAADPEGGSLNDRISGNTIRSAGRVYTDACGIWASFPQGLVIEHNELYNLPYTGISIGWRWDSTPTAARDNRITSNHIHHVMQKHDDGAGIYTLGFQPGTIITGNYIHDLVFAPYSGEYPIAGVYLDEGSDEITLGAHVFSNVPRGSEVNLHKTGPSIHYEKPVLLTPGSEDARQLIEQAGPSRR
jgi:hypothetical protein